MQCVTAAGPRVTGRSAPLHGVSWAASSRPGPARAPQDAAARGARRRVRGGGGGVSGAVPRGLDSGGGCNRSRRRSDVIGSVTVPAARPRRHNRPPLRPTRSAPGARLRKPRHGAGPRQRRHSSAIGGRDGGRDGGAEAVLRVAPG